MSEIPFAKKYVCCLDTETLQSLETLYFDSVTYEVKSKQEFLERRKDEIDASLDSANADINKPHSQYSVEQIQSKLEELKLKNEAEKKAHNASSLSPLVSDSEDIDAIEEENESDQSSKGEDKYDYMYKRQDFSTDLAALNDKTDEESTISFMSTKSPQILFKSNLIDSSKAIAVYKTLLSAKDSPNFDPLLHLKRLSCEKFSNDPIKAGMSAVFMLTSGHFAGAIISHLPHSTKGNQGSASDLQLQSVRLIQHKTFHRYTTRRKQGGSQSSMDDAKGKANSAGSTLRRYNEQALEQDISQVLKEWKMLIDQCDNIFVRAMGKAARLLIKQPGEQNSVIHHGDPRIKSIPFGTKRPTTTEIKKAWIELMYLKIVDYPKVDTAEMNKEKKKKQALEKSQAPVKKSEVTTAINQQNELITLLKKSKSPALMIYLKKNGIDVNTFSLNMPVTPTLLHYASAHGLSHMVKTLLLQANADPTLLNDREKTAYQIAGIYGGDKQLVSLEFSLAKGMKPDANWVGADDIQAMTSDEVENAKLELKKEQAKNEELVKLEKQRALDDAVKHKLDQDKIEKDKQIENKFGKGQSIANTIIRTEEQKLAGLTQEQKMKVMREQRARAIEQRMNL